MYPIPANATRIRYLESTGTQYVDTGVATSLEIRVAGRLSFDYTGGYSAVCGSRTSGTEDAFVFWLVGNGYSGSTKGSLRFDYGTGTGTSVQKYKSVSFTSFSYPVDFSVDGADAGKKLTFGEEALNAELTTSVQTNLNVFLFGVNTNGTATLSGGIRLYRCSIYDGTLVRSFVPVRVGQVGYLFDRVSGTLFGNAGTGSFVLGPDTFSQGVVPTRMMAMGVKRKPYDAQVEYIESTGTQYIDTKVQKASGWIAAKAWASNTLTNTVAALGVQAGGSGSSGRLLLALQSSGNGLLDRGAISGSRIVFASNDVEFDKQQFVLNNLTRTIWIGGANGTSFNKLIGRIYYVQIWDKQSVLIRDFIPVRKGTTGYLYDRVSGRLFGNAGTGSFVCGPDIVPIRYLESTGTQYIDTGVVPTIDTAVEVRLDGWNPDASVTQYLFGAHDTTYKTNVYAFGKYALDQGGYFRVFVNGSGTMATNVGNTQRGVGSMPVGYVRCDSSSVTIDSTTCPYTDAPSTPLGITRTMYLMQKNEAGSVNTSRNFVGRIKGCSIYDGSNLVRDYVPVRVGSVGYLLDKVSNKLYSNAGTGDFVLGPDR